jgi:hypothetical protein
MTSPEIEQWTGTGWELLVRDADEQLRGVDPNYRLIQAKEKFGTLRIYAQPSRELNRAEREIFNGAIADASVRSSATCEVCGTYARLRDDRRWVRTLCEEHAKR